MSILIGHASSSETGTKNGEKGDSTGKEVCTRTWYSKPWDYMALYPDADVREAHAAAVEAACANDNIGYGQSDRNTLNTEAKKVGYDLSKITVAVNTDCSALQNVCALAAATPNATYGSNGWTTSTMRSALKSLGYVILEDETYLKASTYCVRGAIYVAEGSHTVTGLTNGAKYLKTLEAAGLTEESQTTASTETVAAPSYTVGTVYTLQVDALRVRTGPGTSYPKKAYSELTANAQANAYSNGCLKKGTRVTCKETQTNTNEKEIWMRIPSGWICAFNISKIYVG